MDLAAMVLSSNGYTLASDIRYQRLSDEIDARWVNPWTLDDML